MQRVRNILVVSLIVMSLSIPFGPSQVMAEVIHSEVGFLVVAPDRGFLGNEEVRDPYEVFSKEYTTALVFATRKKT